MCDKFYAILSLILLSKDLFGKIFQHIVAYLGAVLHQVDHLHDALTVLIKLIFNLNGESLSLIFPRLLSDRIVSHNSTGVAPF